MIPLLYVFLVLYVVFHLFCRALHHLNLLKWKHVNEKYPEKLTWISHLAGDLGLMKSVYDFYRYVFLSAAIIISVAIMQLRITILLVAGLFFGVEVLSFFVLKRESPEKVFIRFLPAMKIFLLPVYPLVKKGEVGRINNEPEELPTDEEVTAFLTLGKDEGILEPMEGELMQSVADFSDTLVREVMTPRTDMIAVKEEISLHELIQHFLRSRHSRIPVIKENLDDVKGVVHVKDCLEIVYENRMDESVQTIMRNTLFVPETKKIIDLLHEMRELHQHMAIVVDEYGGTAGLVTLEDLLEEIVGEIADEYEQEEDEVIELSPGIYSMAGKAHVDTLDDIFDVPVEDAGYDTIGGLLVTLLGNVPPRGDRISHKNLQFEILESDNRRIIRVKVWKERAGSEEDSGQDD